MDNNDPTNPLTAGPQAAAAGASDPVDGLMDYMTASHGQAAATYQSLAAATTRAGITREELDSLMKLGDTVTQKDVVKGASRLVAAGLDPAEVAGILADMPMDGQPLQAWVAQHDQVLRANEAKLKQLTAVARQRMGVSALKLLGAHSMAAGQGWQPRGLPDLGPSNPNALLEAAGNA